MAFVEAFVKTLQFNGRRLFHFTDSRNLPNITKAGLLPTTTAKEFGLIIATGGDEASLSIDRHKGLDSYVRLSFCRNHPMSHVAKQRGNIQQIRILRICPTVLLREGMRISDQVATANDAVIESPDNMLPKMDHEAVYKYLNWNDPGSRARRLAVEKWEVLIPNPIAPGLISGL